MLGRHEQMTTALGGFVSRYQNLRFFYFLVYVETKTGISQTLQII